MYFITVIRLGNQNKVEDFKTVGYVSDRNEAERCTKENANNIFEGGKYQYAMVCELETGMYPEIKDKEWYNYHVEDEYWIAIDRCDAPEGLEDYKPYIMG